MSIDLLAGCLHIVLSKVIIRQLFGAIGVSGSFLIFYRTEISSGGILFQSNAGDSIFIQNTQSLKIQLSQADVYNVPKSGNELRNDCKRQTALNVPSAPKKGERNSVSREVDQ